MDDLTKFVHDQIGQPFEWGNRDCITFAGNALTAHCGHNPFREWIGEYDSIAGAYRTVATLDHGPIEIANDRYRRVLTLHPEHGMLVARTVSKGPLGLAFGVVVFGLCAFVTREHGVTLTSPEVHDMYWAVE